MDAAFEARLRDLLDRDEIWRVMQRYGRGLDRVDRELASSCYWPDATEDHGHFLGPVEPFIDYADAATLSFVECHHGLMNHSCDLDGDDAHTETYYLFMGIMAEPPHLMSMGRYVDHFQRRNGEWRIADRVTMIERNLELTDSTAWARYVPTPVGGYVAPAARDRSDVSYQRPLRPRRAE